MADKVAPQLLDSIIQQTVQALEAGREQIFEIAETAMAEYETVLKELQDLKQQAAKQIELVDQLEKKDRECRQTLVKMHRSFALFTEAEVLEAHAKAREVHGELVAGRALERALRHQRDQVERRLRSLESMVKRAQNLVTQVGTAMGFLAQNFGDLFARLESAQQSRQLGLHVIRAQEEERRRLAREIHDGPAQLLNSVVLRIDVCQRLFDSDLARLKEELAQLKDLVRLSLQDVRKIIFDLRPMALDDLGLVPALRAFLKDFQAKHGTEVDFGVFGSDQRFEPAFEVAMFRLVQESLNNVQKHAQATRVWVRVEQVGRELRMTVRDDGRGFDVAEATAAGGKFGLMGMRERAELLGGTMEIQSEPGKGARLQFHFPLHD